MFIRMLGILDLFVALMIIAHAHVPVKVIFFCAGYLIVKGALFVLTEDFASYFDLGVGLYMLLLAFNISFTLLSVLCVLFLVQKGLLSLS